MGLYAHFTNISLVSGFVSLVPFLTHIMSKSFKTEHLSQCIVIPHIICICILHCKHIFFMLVLKTYDKSKIFSVVTDSMPWI